MFNELCATARSHRARTHPPLHQPWEASRVAAAATRRPAGLDAYRPTAGSSPAPSTHTSTASPHRGSTPPPDGDTVAITTSTNEHVDAINAAIQAARLDAGHLDPNRRRRHRRRRARPSRRRRRHPPQRPHLTTDDGEPVRNRELWTVTAVHPDGDAHRAPPPDTAPSRSQPTTPPNTSASATPPPNTATSPTPSPPASNSSPPPPPAAASTSAPPAAAPRTPSSSSPTPDATEARDVLERVLATDRADIPAVTQRRHLAVDDRAPHHREPSAAEPQELQPTRLTGRRQGGVDIGF